MFPYDDERNSQSISFALYVGLQVRQRWVSVTAQRDTFSFALDCETQHVPHSHKTIKGIMGCYLNIYKYLERIRSSVTTPETTCHAFQCVEVVEYCLLLQPPCCPHWVPPLKTPTTSFIWKQSFLLPPWCSWLGMLLSSALVFPVTICHFLSCCII